MTAMMAKTIKTGFGIWAAALLVGTMAAPAMAQQRVAGLTASDKAQGSEAYKGIVQQFGGTVGGPLSDYVRRVGLKVAMAASPGSRPADWTITVLNSPVPNAMATPGGYLYITRGLLAMINSEAELASVLGHEAGHIVAQHTSKRNSRATMAGIGSVLAGIFLGGDGARLANTVGSGFVAGYSRSQEYESDQLGLRYAASAGYDPRAAASMLAALERVSTVEGQQSMERGGLQSIFASHPVTRERVQRVAALAAKMPAGGVIDSVDYLKAIDGMTFGDSADQGIVQGTQFRHGGLGFGFTAPAGFQLQNSPSSVVGQSKGGAQFQFQGIAAGANDSLQSVVNSAWSSLSSGSMPQVQYSERRINQMDTLQSSARAYVGGRATDLGITAYRFSPDTVYLFTTSAPAGSGSQFEPLLTSMRKLTPTEAKTASAGKHIDVVTVRPGETADTLAGRMAPPYNRRESLLALNGVDSVRPGEQVKLIVQ